jgi:hypothetical protein
MVHGDRLFKPLKCSSYEMDTQGNVTILKKTPSTCWELYAKELLKTAYESPTFYAVHIRKDLKGIKSTQIKKLGGQ